MVKLDIHITEMREKVVRDIVNAIRPHLKALDEIDALERLLNAASTASADVKPRYTRKPDRHHTAPIDRGTVIEAIDVYLRKHGRAVTSELVEWLRRNDAIPKDTYDPSIRAVIRQVTENMANVHVERHYGQGRETEYKLLKSPRVEKAPFIKTRKPAPNVQPVRMEYTKRIQAFLLDTLAHSVNPINNRALTGMVQQAKLPLPKNENASNIVNRVLRRMNQAKLIHRKDDDGNIYYSAASTPKSTVHIEKGE